MIWKFYFILVVITQAFAMVDLGFNRIWEIIDFLISILSYVGLFGFCWKKPIFKPIFWQIFLFILVIWNIAYLFFIPLPEKYVASTPQVLVAIIMLILYAPLVIGLYLYAFKKEMRIESDVKKKIPKGIKVISFVFVVALTLPFLFQGVTSSLKHGVQNMSNDEKIKIIQTSEYKKLNIQTVDDFDKYWDKHSEKVKFDPIIIAIHGAIIFVLIVGLWMLKEWARLGMLAFSIYKICFEILTFNFRGISIGYLIGETFFLAFFVYIIFYFTRPKIKDHFIRYKKDA